jgi:hypothetical protein
MSRFVLMASMLVVLCGCVSVRVPNYIKADHPYERKMYGDYDMIVATVRNVVVHNGWKIKGETNPSTYERATDDQSTDKDVLLFTDVKQHSMFLYSSYTHLNIFFRAIPEGAMVEIRYGKVTPLWFKQFESTRNDALAERLLQQIEQELLERK